MPVERREQVTRIGIVRVNGQPEELEGPDGRRQSSRDGTSRVSGDGHARFCERLGVKFPGATRRCRATGLPTATIRRLTPDETGRCLPTFSYLSSSGPAFLQVV